jgi:hypothetical protein
MADQGIVAIYELRRRGNSSISSNRAEPDVQLSRGMHYLQDNATSKNYFLDHFLIISLILEIMFGMITS